MNCSNCQPLLSAYVDDSIGQGERAAVDAHLRSCSACHALMQDLAAIRSASQSLDALTPPARVWHQIAATVVEPPRSRFGWLTRQPVMAVAMAAVIAAGLWRVADLLQPAPVPRLASRSDPPTIVTPVVQINAETEADYSVAIARLEEVAAANRDALDANTAGAMNAGLVVIDQAINESRAALQSEPENEPAHESLFEALRRKVALLQEMLALINEMRKGNQDGAARILSEINR
jgi:hypothetical protein